MTPTTPQVSREKTGSATPAIPRGRFVWYELLAGDQAVAKLFYTKVLGWTTEAWKTPPGAPPYTLWSSAGKQFAGLMDLPADAKKMGAPPHWLGYISTPDADASLEQAKKLGAKVLMGPQDIPEVGRFAVIADPQGAVFALFTPRPKEGDTMNPPPEGIVSWNELATSDTKKAYDFYQALFGWQKGEAMDMGPAGTYQILTYEGKQFAAIYPRPKEIPASNWLYYFRVTNLDDTIAKVTANGGKVLNGPMDVPGGRIAQCMDPQGAAFALHWIK
jgi:predicted enzyme related to lactoylglutathione lyase